MAELALGTHRWVAELKFVASRKAASIRRHSSKYDFFQHNHELWSNTSVSLLARRFDDQIQADELLSGYSICHMNPRNLYHIDTRCEYDDTSKLELLHVKLAENW